MFERDGFSGMSLKGVAAKYVGEKGFVARPKTRVLDAATLGKSLNTERVPSRREAGRVLVNRS